MQEYCKTWWGREGPEWAAAQGVAVDVIIDCFGRAPARRHGEPYPPPTVEDVRELLTDGWLLSWITEDR